MEKLLFFLFSFFFFLFAASAQYAPQAGLSGSTAISAASGQFVAWATHCTIQRGFMNIADPSLGYASAGDSSFATGAADGGIVSLGDSGVADLTFTNPITNGAGPDFAVFENGFRNSADSAQAFLELGFVEVSSDGVNYFRFPSASLTQTQVQIGNGNYIDAGNLNNLAGKYIAMYGTPFDLDELAGIPGLDVTNVTHVRIIDVVGSISGHASHDSAGRVINDPYPTPFPSCGFDLDAVGVINELYESVRQLPDNVSISVFPNPASDHISITINGTGTDMMTAKLTTITGSVALETSFSKKVNIIPLTEYPAGMYFLVLSDTNGNKWTEKIIKR